MICPICGQEFGSPARVLCSMDHTRNTAAQCPACGTDIMLKIPRSAWGQLHEDPPPVVLSRGEFLCHIPGRGEPKAIHPSLTAALNEAKRLVGVQSREVKIYRIVAVAKPKTEVTVDYV